MPLPPILQRRFVLVTGKGGVGKSTVVALLARMSAAAGRRTLICELNTRSRVPLLLGASAADGEIRAVEDNLYAVNIDPPAAMEEYALMKLRFRTLYRLVFENPVVESLVRFVPGVNDLLMLGKAFNHERETTADGSPAWDCVVIDAPATGHGLTFFRLPKIIRDAVPGGNLHREAADMWGLLTDPARTAVHLVTLPEALPVRETCELHHTLVGELGLPLGYLWVNRVPPPLLDADQRGAFEAMARPTDAGLRQLWAATRIRLGREALADGHRATLDTLDLPQVILPQLYTGDFASDAIDRLVAETREQACA